MYADRIVVFGTSSIQTSRPVYAGQRPTHEQVLKRGALLRVYSLGKLEYAHKLGMDIHVVTMLPELDECHRWWRSLVPASKVFVSDGLFGELDAAALQAALLDPWKRFYASLRLPWDESLTDQDAAKAALISRHGVIDGANLPGHASC